MIAEDLSDEFFKNLRSSASLALSRAKRALLSSIYILELSRDITYFIHILVLTREEFLFI